MNNLNFKPIYLLPNRFKIIGLFLLAIGIILTVSRFYFGQKPDWLDMKVFAVYSSFLQTKFFTFITNNILEELSGLSVFIGLVFIAFSKEKYEDEITMQIRIRSLFYSGYANILLTILAFLFIFGLGFIYFMVVNIFAFFVIFIIVNEYTLYRYKKRTTNI